MRKIVSWEGKEIKHPDIFIEKGALILPEKPVYIVWTMNDAKPMGKASDFRREENGSITAELDITDGRLLALVDEPLVFFSIFADRVEPKPIAIPHYVTSARVLYVSAFVTGANPAASGKGFWDQYAQ